MTWLRALLALAVGAGSALLSNYANADWFRPGFNEAEPCCWKWSGFYIGGHAGSSRALVDWNNVSLTGERVDNDSNGFIGGGQIGYNWQFRGVVLGVESTLSATDLGRNFTSGVTPAVTYRTDVHSLGTVTGRLGFAAHQFLVYAKGGWAIARDEVSSHNRTTFEAFSFENTRNGWTVGTGLEFMFANGISVGVEYSYVDLGSESVSGTTTLNLPVAIKDIDTRMHLLTARINFY